MDTEGPLAQYYACALKPANVIPDGYQRAMTEIEQETTYLWSIGRLHLASVPKFFTETFVADELDTLLACPRELVEIRMINVSQGDEAYSAYVHHHLSAFKFPS
ncbi:hypothetical protein ATCC90586_003196 [Pythium insidiosum]|nr:hypothetical protein ATCC90586_003196 [Pythium insidiosum]